MNFWKLHGVGNDFIAIDGRFDNIDSNDYSDLAKRVCHRHFGIGADGLLVVKNSDVCDVEMVYYNSDGSRANMCGNGLRCFCKFVYDNNIVNENEFTVYTLDGVKKISLNIYNDKINTIRVNMGKANFNPKNIPVNTDKEVFINEKLVIDNKEFIVSSVLMGVPHTIVFVDEINKKDIYSYGELIEKNKVFPQNTNVNFVKIDDRDNIKVYTWERGCGYTLGCGTGMTASVIVANYLDKVDNIVNVSSEGGTVKIEILDDVYMIGNAVKICEGTLEV
ncbi:diaminopimelate epimerase [[Clostridium] sordellii]|uniref:Diaminopimelate epimerase n=1 Tax=Paraclostridium sordellii TaxID=1505 RepID=A0A9P1PAH6_PARSO|nr:diaminopimelate epimerase [Paeniclostridium sordellii]MDU2147925.1 diaminopimelate epimerase [Paeniclostridium sordellii]MDU4413518.1 diaminopimelate epimerase [Paeniclostridium sordellii]MRZ27707.1 diaminopimelate epimerase [Paeniclostridium sordellii]MVO73392.1 diaminopimelate epimerase [Paeniclostridium sordellii]CEK35636.1 diaminopimelate epimerase,Diaminopimelate epimerase,diaminopimelate epimerase,Diaminopimelate epimerase,diaminopimelate epimerase,Diaminopimelate epimerase [[Clostrid